MLEKPTEKELNEIAEFIAREFKYTGMTFAMLKKKVENPKFELFVLRESKQWIAFIELEYRDSNAVRVNGIGVQTEHRNKGYGKKIIQEATGYCRNKGIQFIRVYVREDNASAKKMYEETGFQFVDVYLDRTSKKNVEEMELDTSNETPSYVS